LVDVQPEDTVTVEEDGDAGTPLPIPMEKEVQKAEVRRSARLAGKQSSQPTPAPPPTRKPRRVRQLVTRYLVKWRGYGVEECYTEARCNLTQAETHNESSQKHGGEPRIEPASRRYLTDGLT